MGAPFVVREYVRWGDVDIVGIIRYDDTCFDIRQRYLAL